jgi:hypothetical protein
LKVNKNLVRRKTKAAKVATAEREKKIIYDPSPVTDLEKKIISKKRVASVSQEEKCVVAEEKRPDNEEPAGKRVQIRRRMRTLISCRLPGLSPQLAILQKGKR